MLAPSLPHLQKFQLQKTPTGVQNSALSHHPNPPNPQAPTSTLVAAAHLWQGSADPELGRHPRRGSAEPRQLVPHPRVFFHILFFGKDKTPLTACIQLLAACADSC